jgi:hypothetical protein
MFKNSVLMIEFFYFFTEGSKLLNHWTVAGPVILKGLLDRALSHKESSEECHLFTFSFQAQERAWRYRILGIPGIREVNSLESEVKDKEIILTGNPLGQQIGDLKTPSRPLVVLRFFAIQS